MIAGDKTKYQDLFKKATDFLTESGYQNIKADLEGFDEPRSYKQQKSDVTFTPDIVAEKNGSKYIFELGLKSENPTQLKSKWLLLNTLSQIRDFKFRIITSRGHLKFTNELIDSTKIASNGLIKI